MTAGNTAHSYGTVTKTFHWLTALFILTLIPTGFIAYQLPYDTSEQLAVKAQLFSIHKTVGVTLFFIALARIGWAISQPKPGPLHPERKLEHWAAETAHWLLYGSLVIVPLSGWIHHAATTGFAPILWPFGQSLPFVPKDTAVAGVFAGLHKVFAIVLTVTLIAHVAGALKHHIIDRSPVLTRMWFGSPQMPKAGTHTTAALPAATAIGAWAVAIGIGSGFGAYTSHAAIAPQAVELEQVASDWQVQDGQIAITVTQLTSPVEGQFADWTAAITFDPEVTDGTAGSVEVQISIPSLTLGSVTGQAMGADYFNAEEYPTATFEGDILAGPDGYRAEGTLTIKDQSVPVGFPFDLTLEGDTADMQASLTLDRMAFGIGENMTDEASLGFDVSVDLSVAATRGEDSGV